MLAIPLGLLTGAMLGSLGAGGSVLTVPALVYLLGQSVAEATTAALVIVSANAAVGAVENARRGTIDVRLAVGLGSAGLLGALAGSHLSSLVGGGTILFLLALVMLGSAWSLWSGGTRRPAVRGWSPPARAAVIAGLGLGIGILTGFFGVGGGFLIVPALVVVLGVPVARAIGTSLLVITVTALAGVAGHLLGGGVSWPVTIAFGGAGMVGALIGSRGGGRLSDETLGRAFAVMLVVVAVLLLIENASALVG